MAHAVQFVDSIAASPTVRLNINSGPFNCYRFDAPPPPLRLAAAENMMRDGGYVSSSSFGDRTLGVGIQLVGSNEDAWAADWQTLVRELNRPTNIIRYLPEGATSPVFFKTYRAAPEDLAELVSVRPRRDVSIPVRAEPFALGLRETLGPYTVTQDPAAGANGHYVDVTGVIGDVPARPTIVNTTALRAAGVLAVRQHGTPTDMVWWKQAEDCTLNTDTTNPGGSADGAMSGAGTTNFARTTFSTATMATRFQWPIGTDLNTQAKRRAMRGRFRALVAVRRSGASSVMKAQLRLYFPDRYTAPVTIPATTNRQIVDLGVFDLTPTIDRLPHQTDLLAAGGLTPIEVQASRSGAAENLDWDYLMLFPATEATLTWLDPDDLPDTTDVDMMIDANNEAAVALAGNADPYHADAYVSLARSAQRLSGSIPMLVPGQVNRLFLVSGGGPPNLHQAAIARTDSLAIHYFPHYLHVRPATT